MNILITGATRGIGKAIGENISGLNNVLKPDSLQYEVFAAARNEELLREYKHYCVCDLATIEGMEKLGNYIQENKIDILINNAGEYNYSPIESIRIKELEHITRLNLEAPLYLISKAVPYMKSKNFGRIINIGSISGVMGEANASLYSASKSGLIGAAKALALELAEFGITVNTINPGWVDTDLGNSSADGGDFTKEEIVECIPQRRFVKPSEVAGMVRYLISDDAKGVTGQSINLCAGLTCGC